jgi:hypothetical protein
MRLFIISLIKELMRQVMASDPFQLLLGEEIQA